MTFRTPPRTASADLDRRARGRQPELLFETDEMLIEAPNWSLDGTALSSTRMALSGVSTSRAGAGAGSRIDFEDLPELNNDHVLDPDGEHIYMSAMDGHIYRGALDGGAVERVSPEDGRLAFSPWRVPGRIAPCLRPHRRLRRTGPTCGDGTPWSNGRCGHRAGAHRRARVVTRRRLDPLQHRKLHQRAGPRPTRTDPGRGRPGGAPRHQRHRRLVPAPLAGLAVGDLHRFPCGNTRASRRSRR